MLGQRALDKAVITLTEEGVKQYDIVTEEIKKLADITEMGWDLTSSRLLDKVRLICYYEGAAMFAIGFFGSAALFGTLKLAKQIRNERRLKEKGLT